jgi:hypothetical protein
MKVETRYIGQKNKHVEKKHKIIVISYSYARGYATEIKLNSTKVLRFKDCKSRYRGE